MAEAYTVLWTVERYRWLRRVGDEGPIEVVFGGPHTSLPSIAGVRPGDSIFPVAVIDGSLRLIAHLTVDRILSPEQFVLERFRLVLRPGQTWDMFFHELEKTRPDIGHRVPTTCADQAAVGQGTAIRFDRIFPGADLTHLRFGPKASKERPLTGITDDRLTNSFSLQGHVRRLSADSAERIAQEFESA
jgi:hypothetical protein